MSLNAGISSILKCVHCTNSFNFRQSRIGRLFVFSCMVKKFDRKSSLCVGDLSIIPASRSCWTAIVAAWRSSSDSHNGTVFQAVDLVSHWILYPSEMTDNGHGCWIVVVLRNCWLECWSCCSLCNCWIVSARCCWLLFSVSGVCLFALKLKLKILVTVGDALVDPLLLLVGWVWSCCMLKFFRWLLLFVIDSSKKNIVLVLVL